MLIFNKQGMKTLKRILITFLIIILVLAFPLNNTSLAAELEDEYVETTDGSDDAETEDGADAESTEAVEPTSDENGFPIITCQSAVVMDASTGQIIYEKDAYSKQFPASTTKIMTTLIALEKGNQGDTLTMSENAIWGIDRDSSHIGLDVGEEINMKDGLYAIMMSSANEVCIGVAEHISGDTDSYCQLMNDKAKELGCVSTNFVNVNGLHDDNHYTCAYDLALITRAALSNEQFREMAACTYYEIPATNKVDDIRYLWQNNNLINQSSEYYYSFCTGGKTGFTDQAGGTLVTWASYNGMELICVVMNTFPQDNTFSDSIKLYDYMFYNYYYHEPLVNYEFSPEQLTDVQKLLNEYYGCENAGRLKLTAETNQQVLVNYSADPESFWQSVSLSTDRINENIIGSLKVHDSNVTYIEIPVYFSGYVRSDDPEALRAAYAEGTLIELPKPKKSSIISRLAMWLIVLVLILIFLPLKVTSKPRTYILSKIPNNQKKKTKRR